jgi:hypothetical protein
MIAVIVMARLKHAWLLHGNLKLIRRLLNF